MPEGIRTMGGMNSPEKLGGDTTLRIAGNSTEQDEKEEGSAS
jgi:hypothetical protein